MKARHFAIFAMATVVLGADLLAGGRNPGSVLVYPVHRSGTKFFTVVAVTNSNLKPMTPVSLGGATNVHFEYANVVPNSKDPFCPKNCIIFDRIEFLTPADTLSVLTGCHNATTSGGQEGFLVVSAEDPAKYRKRWSHNYLMGSSLVINASGSIYELNAVPFESPVAEGGETDLNKNGRIDFDDKEYEGIPDILYIDSFIGLAGSQLSLINFTGKPTDTNTVLFSVWNDYEYPLSATLDFKCWFDEPLYRVNPLFSQDFLARLPNDRKELDITCNGKGDIETGWAIIQSIGVRTPGGTMFDRDGAMLGTITSGGQSRIAGGRLLWESKTKQTNGVFGY